MIGKTYMFSGYLKQRYNCCKNDSLSRYQALLKLHLTLMKCKKILP